MDTKNENIIHLHFPGQLKVKISEKVYNIHLNLIKKKLKILN